MHYDHRQPFAPGVRGLPMAKNETRSAIGVGGFHLDELALRLRQGVSARQKVAEDGLGDGRYAKNAAVRRASAGLWLSEEQVGEESPYECFLSAAMKGYGLSSRERTRLRGLGRWSTQFLSTVQVLTSNDALDCCRSRFVGRPLYLFEVSRVAQLFLLCIGRMRMKRSRSNPSPMGFPC